MVEDSGKNSEPGLQILIKLCYFGQVTSAVLSPLKTSITTATYLPQQRKQQGFVVVHETVHERNNTLGAQKKPFLPYTKHFPPQGPDPCCSPSPLDCLLPIFPLLSESVSLRTDLFPSRLLSQLDSILYICYLLGWGLQARWKLQEERDQVVLFPTLPVAGHLAL